MHMDELLKEIGDLVARHAGGGWASLYISKRDTEPVWISLFTHKSKAKSDVINGAKAVAEALEGKD